MLSNRQIEEKEAKRWPLEYSLFKRTSARALQESIRFKPYVHKDDIHRIIGRHVLAEFWIPNFQMSAEALATILRKATERAGAGILQVSHFNDDTGKKTAIVIISESHVIAHYFPNGYLAIDAYTCGQTVDPMLILNLVKHDLHHEPYDSIMVNRGIISKSGPLSGSGMLSGIAAPCDNQLAFFSHSKRYHPANHQALHFIVEMHFANTSVLTQGDRLKACFSHAFKHEFKAKHTHAFEPVGVAGVSLVFAGLGIHITTHPWPELLGYTPMDLFVDQSHAIDVKAAIGQVAKSLATSLGPVKFTVRPFQRGVTCKDKPVQSFHQINPVTKNAYRLLALTR